MSFEPRKNTAIARLKMDYMRLKRDGLPYIEAEPLPQNFLEWHYVVRGPEDSPYFGGYFHGTLMFPRDYPFKPPAIYMNTPNGRFKTGTRLCLSMSDFHPDTWNPAWSVPTILTGLLSFMLEKTPTLGSTETSVLEKERLARESLKYNLKNEKFCELFPEMVDEINKKLCELEEAQIRNAKLMEQNGYKLNPNENNNNNNNRLNNCNNDNNTYNGRSWYTLLSNVIVIVGFGAFAFIVNQVIRTLNTD